MDAEERDSHGQKLDRLVGALEAERARHVAGLEPEPTLRAIFAMHREVLEDELLAALKADGPPAAWLAGLVARLQVEAAQAGHEEAWRAAEAAAVAVGPEGKLPLCEAEAALATEPDRNRRRALAEAVARALEPAAGQREAAVEVRARARAERGQVPDWGLVIEGDQLLAASDDAWRDLLTFAARRDLGLEPAPRGDLRREDLLRLVAFPKLDGLFRAAGLPALLRGAVGGLGLDLDSIRIEPSSRPAAWPGAHAFGARVAWRGRGGLPDWPDLLDAAGQALTAAAHPPRRRRPGFVATLGSLLSGLLLEPRFLAGALEVDRKQAPDLVRALGLRALFRLRVASAALRVATEVERGLGGAAWREAHREAVSAAVLATWEGVRAPRDGDAAALATRLTGFAAGERLRGQLRERFDEDWWRNPRTREHLAGLLAAGEVPDVEEPSVPAAARGLSRLLELGGAL